MSVVRTSHNRYNSTNADCRIEFCAKNKIPIMRKQQTLNSFFKPSSINPPNPVTKRNSDDSIISTSPKKKHLNGSEIVEANNSIQRINDIGLFINCDLKNAEKNLVSKLFYLFRYV